MEAVPRCPRSQARRPGSCHDDRLGDLSGRAHDQYAPAGLGEGVDVVDLKGHLAVANGCLQFGSLAREEQNLVADEGVVDREDERQFAHGYGHSADALLAEQPSALLLGEHFNLITVHHMTPQICAWRSVSASLSRMNGSGQLP